MGWRRGGCPKESSKTCPFLPSHNPALQQKPHSLPYIITDITVPPSQMPGMFHVTPRRHKASAVLSVIPAAGGVQGPRAEGLGWQVRRAVLNTACTSRMEDRWTWVPLEQEAPGGQLVGSSRHLERSLLKQDGKQGWQRDRNLKGILLRGEVWGKG